MKTLLLMRHAKSSWKEKDIPDEQRPLNKRGRHDAPRMGHLLDEQELVPQRILSSSAARARETAMAVIENCDFRGEVDFQDRLYMAEAEEYLQALREQPDDMERIMVIGHNPGLETLLQLLSERIEPLPTAVIAHLALPIQRWSELSDGATGELIQIWRPKEVLAEEETQPAKKKEKEKTKDKEKSKHKSRKKKDK